MTDRDYEAAVDKAMSACKRCVHLDPQRRDAHRNRCLEEIERTQAREPHILPSHVWLHGRAPSTKAETW